MKRRDFVIPLLLLQVIPTSIILHRLMADHFASYREAGYEDTVVDIDAPDVDLPILADVFDEQYQFISTDKERKRLGAGSSRDATPKKTKPKEKREQVNLPPTFWVNLDTSVDRRKAMMASFSSLGIIENTHRVPASNVSDMMNMLNSGQLVFHPKIKLEPATEKTWEKQYHYNYQEAACLLSHLRAIKQAYDEGHELALFLEDDASLPSTFVNEWVEYIKLAPKDWKVLQFAPSNKVVVKQLAKLHDPFISWQTYSWSCRAYMINRAGMKTLMDKIYLLSSEGKGIWSLQQQKPMVVSDEVVYSVIGDAHTSTGLRVDGLSFNSTVQEKSNPLGGVANTYRKSEISDLAQQVAMKKETKVFDQSLLVLMNVRISNEADIEKEVGRIVQDVDAVCKFHHKCTWEVNLVATDSALMNRFIELSSEIPPNVNFQETVSPSPFNKFSFIKKFVGKMADFDLVLIKDNDQRTSGFPWRTFVGRKGNAIVAGPLRKTASEGMQQDKKVTKRQWFSFHEAKHWTEPNRIFAYLFMSIKPTEVPLLEQYFVLFDAKFASFFFNITLTPAFVDQLSAWGPDYLWCQAAAQWGNNTRPGCYLIPVVSSHDDTRQISKTKEWIEAGHKMLDAFRKDPPFTNWMKPSDQWSNIIGNKGHYAIVRRCCNLTGQNSCDTFENLQTCSMWFANDTTLGMDSSHKVEPEKMFKKTRSADAKQPQSKSANPDSSQKKKPPKPAKGANRKLPQESAKHADEEESNESVFVKSFNYCGGSKANVVVLSFDDSPDATSTPIILDILRTKQVKATFFIQPGDPQDSAKEHRKEGTNDEKCRIVRRMLKEGHDVQQHSFNHPHFTSINKEAIKRELDQTTKWLEECTGKPSTMTIFRPPYGDFSKKLTEYVNSLNLTVGTWNVDTNDWRFKGEEETFSMFQKDAEELQSRNISSSIVLMHDFAHQGFLDRVIEYYHQKEYEFVTMKECARICSLEGTSCRTPLKLLNWQHF